VNGKAAPLFEFEVVGLAMLSGDDAFGAIGPVRNRGGRGGRLFNSKARPAAGS